MPLLLLGNCTAVTFGQPPAVIDSGAVLVDGGLIQEVGQTAALRRAHPESAYVDLHGDVLMPGMTCAHTHLYGALARGMAIPGAAPSNFPEILQRLWWRLDRALTLESVKASAEALLCDAVRHGCTTVVDHHASPRAIDGSLDVIAEASKSAGVRACLAYEVSDRDGEDVARAGVAENERFIRHCLQNHDELLSATFGLHAAFTLSDATLDTAASHSSGAGFHLHISEDPVDAGAVGRLNDRGILGPRSIAAHCVHVTEDERKRLIDSGTTVVHNIRSNMNNAVGLPPDVPGTAFGNDGFSMNMFQELKFAYLAPKLAGRDPRLAPGDQVLEMATANNAKLIAKLWQPFGISLKVGEISAGAAADLIVLDYRPPTPLTADNAPWHVIFGIDGTHVKSTMVAGRWLMKDRQLLTIDEERAAAHARDEALKLWQRVEAG